MAMIKITVFLCSFIQSYQTIKNATCLNWKSLKVFALNTWGIPEMFGTKDKEVRMKEIGNLLQKQEFDIYLFSELWMRTDYDIIKSFVPKGDIVTLKLPFEAREGSVDWKVSLGDFVFKDDILCEVDKEPLSSPIVAYVRELIVAQGEVVTPGTGLLKVRSGEYVMSDYGQLADPLCDGIVTPSECSGLSIVSRFPLDQISFTAYKSSGEGADFFAKKGIGRVRIKPHRNYTVHVFLTHTCAEDNNDWCREEQMSQLVDAIDDSSADFVVLGGDLNVDPWMPENSYNHIDDAMVNSMEDFCNWNWLEEFCKFNFSFARMATYGNKENTYSNKESHMICHYIFHKANENNAILTRFFQVPILKSKKTNSSLSDHEAVITHLLLCKQEMKERIVMEENTKEEAKIPILESHHMDEESPLSDDDMFDSTKTNNVSERSNDKIRNNTKSK